MFYSGMDRSKRSRSFLAGLAVALVATRSGAQAAASDLRLTAPIATWDEAVPLGSGLLGGLLWGGGHHIILSLDRGDLWDQRPAAPFGQPGYTWTDLQRLVRDHKEDSLHIRFDDPYDNVPYPTKIPAGRLTISLDSSLVARTFGLRLARAEGWVDMGGAELRAFFSATEHVALVDVPAPAAVALERPASLDALGYGPASFGRRGAVPGVHRVGTDYVVRLRAGQHLTGRRRAE